MLIKKIEKMQKKLIFLYFAAKKGVFDRKDKFLTTKITKFFNIFSCFV